MASLSKEFLSHFYYGLRDEYLEHIQKGERPLLEVFLGLTRNNPAVVTCSKDLQPNGSIKSVGFIPKATLLAEITQKYDEFLLWRWQEIKKMMGADYEGEGWLYSPYPDFIVDGLKHSLKYIHLPSEEAEKKIDFDKLGTLEGFGTKTWHNLQENKKAAIVYYLPPGIHFQVSCTVEIQKAGPIREFFNRVACAAHGDNPAKWPQRTAYIFHVEEVIDKSVYRKT